MSDPETKPKRTYFRATTASQRRLLFETYEATKSVTKACAKARVSRGTFYYWQPRFEAGGYAALEHEESRAPHRTRIPPTGAEIVAEVIAYRQAHPKAGYRTVTQRIRQQHEWQPVIGATKVRQILIEAGMVAPSPGDKPVTRSRAVHAPAAEQTVNIDLCVVPVSHEAQTELRSASLSAVASGDFPPAASTGAD